MAIKSRAAERGWRRRKGERGKIEVRRRERGEGEPGRTKAMEEKKNKENGAKMGRREKRMHTTLQLRTHTRSV